MNRRQFLSAGILLWAGGRAFGDIATGGLQDSPKPRGKDPRPTGPKNLTLGSALADARKRGRALLVLVAAKGGKEQYSRGHAFGEYLNFGTDAQLLPLARAEVACATVDELKRHGISVRGEPLLVRVDPGGQLRTAAPQLAEYDSDYPLRPSPKETRDDNEVSDERIAAIAAAVRELLGDAPAGASVDAIRARLVKRPPAGARWGNSGGCATDMEDTPEEIEAQRLLEEWERRHPEAGISMKSISGVGCGMGHVPEKSRRFLSFFKAAAEE